MLEMHDDDSQVFGLLTKNHTNNIHSFVMKFKWSSTAMVDSIYFGSTCRGQMKYTNSNSWISSSQNTNCSTIPMNYWNTFHFVFLKRFREMQKKEKGTTVCERDNTDVSHSQQQELHIRLPQTCAYLRCACVLRSRVTNRPAWKSQFVSGKCG